MKILSIRSIVSSILFLSLVLSLVCVHAADWPCWRGANRNGLSSETGLLRNWTEESQPVLLWKCPSVGQTMNGVAVLGNLVYTIGTKGGSECVFCIDSQTGKPLWARPIGKSYGAKNKFPLQRSTPTLYKDLLYVVSSSGNLVCMNAANGATLWVRNMVTTMGGVLPPGGYCESPYVDGKWVIVCPGGPNASMVAVNRHWGMNVWAAAAGMPAGYTSIIKASFGREHQYVSFTGGGLLGVKVKGGDVRWRYEAPAHESGFNVCPPIWYGQTILASSAAGTGCVWVQKDGTTFKTSEVWFRDDLQIPTGDMIKVNDYVFACNDTDGLVCFNYKTGDKLWSDKTLFAAAFEEEVDSDEKPSKRKSGRKTSMILPESLNFDPELNAEMNFQLTQHSANSPIPETLWLNSPLLGQTRAEGGAAGAANTIEIAPAPKTRKKKKVLPPATPVCMGTFAYAEGLLYLRTSMGELVLLEASAEGCKIRGRITLPQMKTGLAVTPVIANGFLFLREGGTLYCFDLRDQSRKSGADGTGSDGSDGGNGGGNGGKALPGMPTGPGVRQRTAPKVG